jgi:hypothetical protein
MRIFAQLRPRVVCPSTKLVTSVGLAYSRMLSLNAILGLSEGFGREQYRGMSQLKIVGRNISPAPAAAVLLKRSKMCLNPE